jgi:hypothetical protein
MGPEMMITVKGRDIAEELRVKAEGRDPDAFDMYIYNGKSPHCHGSRRVGNRRVSGTEFD